ncbi:MAG: glycosyltransferase family 39 protein, partial [Candidatus Omnitrophota bacterium]|nr:glycosyltransferase family 39 protein [Candidatus Omnitrophota bacterium]
MRPAIDWVIVGLLGIAALFLFTNLDSGYLWQDEAETAVLARNTLQFGYPRAFDGRNYVAIESAIGYGPGTAWVYSPWLPFYLLAAVFAVAGESTVAARFPFAVFGCLSVWLTWRLARRLTPDRWIQRLSVALVVCSVPFLLHMRQCRYYSLTTVLLLAICLSYLHFLTQPTRGRSVWLGILVALLFHTNFGLVLPVIGAMLIHQVRWGTRMTQRWLLSAGGVGAALTVPWALAFYRPGAFTGTMTAQRLMDHAEYYVRVTNKYLMPLAAIAVSAIVWRLWRWEKSPTPHRGRLSPSIRWFFALLAGLWAVFLLLPDQRHMRYLIPLAPLMAIGTAWWLAAWMARSRLIGWSLTAVALLTNVLQSSHLKIPLADFAYELTHTYRGPMEGIVDYLNAHAN